MSLFTSLQLAGNSLQAAQIGLQVTGNNIANANTPGYIRQAVEFATAPTQLIGTLPLTLGVRVQAIVQRVDTFLLERLRHAGSDLANGRTQEEAYSQLEAIVGELSDTDLSTSLSDFFGSIQDVLNQPEDVAVRNLAVLRAETLTGAIGRLASRVRTVQQDVNDRVIASADDINRLIHEVADLNLKISELEAGTTSHSDAVGLRDERELALRSLAEIVDISTAEQENGSITVYVGGDFLVFDGNVREVSVEINASDALGKGEIQLAATRKPLPLTSGRLAGLVTARDEVLGGFLDQLDAFSATLIQEFNRIYTSGQGLVGHDELASQFTVSDTAAALDQAALPFTPVNGSFQVQVFNTQTGLTHTTDLLVKLNGLDDDTSLDSLQQALDAIDGLSARITSSRGLVIEADSPAVQFAFASDTSGVLTALGIGGFFTGTGAGDIGVSSVVQDNPAKFAASGGGVGADTDIAVLLAGFMDRPLDAHSGASLATLYDRMIADTTQGAAVAKAVADGFEVFQQTLEAQNLAISGVSIDEEAVKMIQYQRSFQASAKFLSTVNELLELLVNL